MNSYRSVTLDYTVLLTSGLHIGTGYGLANLIDERTTRGPHALVPTQTRMPYIPGASMKGRFSTHATQLIALLFNAEATGQTLCRDLFGSAQQPGRLFFGDAHLVRADQRAIDQSIEYQDGDEQRGYIEGALLPYLAVEERARAALSPLRHTALPQRLVRFEAASPGLQLSGTVRGWLPAERAEAGLALLMLAARSLTHVGGHKGRGLGAVTINASAMLDDAPADLAALVEKLQ